MPSNFPNNPDIDDVYNYNDKSFIWDGIAWRASSELLPPTPSEDEWIRNPTWAALPAVTSAEQKLVGLYAIFPNANFLAMTVAGAYTVDWGDGVTENFNSGATAYHEYSFSDSDLDNTNGPVTFTDSTDTVNRNNHGYLDGYRISFASITSTTGITAEQIYYVINATQNTFQLSETPTGSPITLTTDGSGVILPYKQAIVIVTPQSGSNMTSLNLAVKHNQAGLVNNYSTGWLDVRMSGPNLTSSGLTFASSSNNVRHHLVEQVEFLTVGSVSSMQAMFFECRRLQSLPLFDTSHMTGSWSDTFRDCNLIRSIPLFNTSNVASSMSSTFLNCHNLRSVPPFDTGKVTSMTSMFRACYSLTSIPLLDTANATNMNSLFFSCNRLTSVPKLNTANVTNMSNMFILCSSLTSVPLLDTAKVTDMSFMFRDCAALTTIPKFNTANVTNMREMFLRDYSLTHIPQLETANVVNMNLMFSTCVTLQQVPALNVSAVNSSTNLTSIFATCASISRIEATGFAYTFSVANCKLSAEALNELFTNLASVSGQTITITGNYGAATCNQAIATDKGWTVTV